MPDTQNEHKRYWIQWTLIFLSIMSVTMGYGQLSRDPGASATDTSTILPEDVSEGAWGDDGAAVVQEYVFKKASYSRFIPPYDSMREIIFYENIIEDEACENCGADSLYWRAKKYLTDRFGKEAFKKMIVEDKVADRLTLLVSKPMLCSYGKFNKRQEGTMEYRLILRFKDARYKYQFGNFVHIEVEDGMGARVARIYHEYYMRLKKGFEQTDKFLLAADTETKELVAGLKKTLREPYLPDEDNW
ncbi:MAG: DUF4468 domain-containing protein [Flavobacteriaceae bacterium]|nr:DUF4468 domain-containing protein [Flavobacteriaceae bacterium]